MEKLPAEPRRRPARLRRLPRQPRIGRRLAARQYRAGAERRLRRFRQGSVLAVALTALLLMIWGGPIEGALPQSAEQEAAAAVADATTTIRALADNFVTFAPRLVIGAALLLLAALLGKLARLILERALGAWQRTAAVVAMTRLVVFVIAAVAAVSILAGDVRTVLGSVGLLGLAASWALQTPIESFTGWLLNSFRGYYRVGDRIAVGDVFGDVYRIDVLTTTVWEVGGPGKAVAAAQATGALITFPNWEVLRSNIVNYSRRFPFVWDEITVNVANESDLGYCAEVLEATARRVLGEDMQEAARHYDQILREEQLLFDVEEVPRVYLSGADSWTECTIRYLVPVRARRRWSSALLLEISRELARPAHRGRIISVYPRREVLRPTLPQSKRPEPS